MSLKTRRFKTAILTIGAGSDVSCQVESTAPTNNTPDGARFYTYCADGSGSYVEEVDDNWAVTIKYRHDWTTGGISRQIQAADGTTVALSLNFDNGVTGWDRTWEGNVVVKAPGDGGDARSPQEATVTWLFTAKPTLTYND